MGLRALAVSFARVQRSEAKSPHTIRLYSVCIRRLVRFVETETGSDALSGLTETAPDRLLRPPGRDRASVHDLDRLPRPSGVHQVARVRGRAEGSNPMDRLRPAEQLIRPGAHVPTEAGLRALVMGRARECRFVTAVTWRCSRLLIDCGLRRTELAALCVADVDMDRSLVTVTGKGKTRDLPFGAKTALALDRYLRVRARQRAAVSPALWLGLTPSGVYQTLRGRAETAGVTGWYTHRHSPHLRPRVASTRAALRAT